MTVKLKLKPEVEAGLASQAQARGLSLEAYLERVLREVAAKRPPAGKAWHGCLRSPLRRVLI